MLKAVILFQFIIEGTQAERLPVLIISGINDMPIPKRIIRQNEPAHRNQRIDEVQIRAIIPLIGIDEDEIVWVMGDW